jgi:hypothetical protein
VALDGDNGSVVGMVDGQSANPVLASLGERIAHCSTGLLRHGLAQQFEPPPFSGE